MTEAIEQELAALRRATQTTPPEKVIKLLTKYGFVEEVARRGRRVFSHPERLGPPVVVPDDSPMLPAYVKRIADAIEEVMLDDA